MNIEQFFYLSRNRIHHVTGEVAIGPDSIHQPVSRGSVQVGAGVAGSRRCQALNDQSGDDSRQDVPHTAGGHSGVAGWIYKNTAIRMGNDGSCAFQNDVNMIIDRKIPRTFYSILLDFTNLTIQ